MGEDKELLRKKEMYRQVLSSRSGREFVWEVISDSGLYHDIAGTPEEMGRQLGRRSLGLKILSEALEYEEEKAELMMRESRNRHKENEDDNRSNRNDDSGSNGDSGISGYEYSRERDISDLTSTNNGHFDSLIGEHTAGL